jgi:hypothetical protein
MLSVTIHFYVSDHVLITTGLLKLILLTIIRKIIFKIFRSNYHKNSDRFMYPSFVYW